MVSLSSLDLCTAGAEDANTALLRLALLLLVVAQQLDAHAVGLAGRGNYNVGVKEQIIFPELEYDKIDALRGLNISITTSAKTDEECRALLTAFKFPFKT